MLNIDLVEKLYNGLSKKKKRELRTKLFGESNQSVSYFRKNKDTTLAKIEILADFFSMPLDGLRLGSEYVFDNRIKRIALAKRNASKDDAEPDVTEVSQKNLSAIEAERIRLQNDVLKESLAVKEERIGVLLEKIDILQEKLGQKELSKAE